MARTAADEERFSRLHYANQRRVNWVIVRRAVVFVLTLIGVGVWLKAEWR